jgi:hypothetical protein
LYDFKDLIYNPNEQTSIGEEEKEERDEELSRNLRLMLLHFSHTKKY